MGENANFGLGFITSLGRNVMREREERTKREREDRELTEQQSAKKLGMLQKLVETDDLLPDEARNVAAQHLLRLGLAEKTKPKDYDDAFREIMTTASQPRPTPATIANDATRRIAEENVKLPTAPGSLFGMVPRLPDREQLDAINAPRETVSGILRPEEVEARSFGRMRRNLEAQREFSTAKAVNVEAHDGIYTFDPNGKQIGYTPFRTPLPAKQDSSRTFEEVLLDPSATPEQKKIAEHFLTLRATNQGDTPRTGSSGSSGSPGAAIWVDTPTGPALIFPKFMNPGGQPIVSLPEDVDKRASDKQRNDSADMQAMIGELESVAKMLPDHPEATGPFDSIAIAMSKWGLGSAPSDEVTRIRSSLYDVVNAQLHALSGAAISATEYARLKQSLPLPNDRDEVVIQKVNEFVRRAKNIFNLRYGPRGVGNARVFPGDVEAQGTTTTTAPRLPAPPPPTGFQPV